MRSPQGERLRVGTFVHYVIVLRDARMRCRPALCTGFTPEQGSRPCFVVTLDGPEPLAALPLEWLVRHRIQQVDALHLWVAAPCQQQPTEGLAPHTWHWPTPFPSPSSACTG